MYNYIPPPENIPPHHNYNNNNLWYSVCSIYNVTQFTTVHEHIPPTQYTNTIQHHKKIKLSH